MQIEFFTATSYNIIADLHGVNDDNIVMAGAHLDSVPAGPGINDNGSGSAALLEIGQQLAHHVPQNTIRLAWWGGEELGLLGSTAWVGQQDQASLDRIALYMNFDMIASPNFIYMVYDANESTHPAPVEVPEGSTDIERTLEQYLTLANVPYDDTEFSGRSDYQAFIENDIPSSGLFTGAEEPKTAEQQAIWGGVAGAQLDPCYHAECDTIDNIDDDALAVNSDAIAFAILKYSYSTESVNGVPGRPRARQVHGAGARRSGKVRRADRIRSATGARSGCCGHRRVRRRHGCHDRPMPAAIVELQHGDYLISTDPRASTSPPSTASCRSSRTGPRAAPFEVQRRAIEHSALVVGAYPATGEQVGFARMVTDLATWAWLCDVYVVPEHRGGGLGTAVVRTLSSIPMSPESVGNSWRHAMPTTLYAKFGYRPLDDPTRWMHRGGPAG